MTQEAAAVQPSAAPATPPPAPPPATDEGAATPAPSAATEAPAAQPPAPAPDASAQPRKTPWYEQRIAVLTKKNAEMERALNEARAGRTQEPAPAATPPPAAPPATTAAGPGAPSQAEIDRLATERAVQIRQQERFTEACNRTYEAGKKALPDFDAALKNFDLLGGLGQHPALVEAATALPEGHKVLHHLGTNLDEAARILSLPPIQMAIELYKVAGDIRAQAAPTVSGAPPPIAPVNGTANPAARPDDKGDFPDQATYKAWREKHFRKR